MTGSQSSRYGRLTAVHYGVLLVGVALMFVGQAVGSSAATGTTQRYTGAGILIVSMLLMIYGAIGGLVNSVRRRTSRTDELER